MNTKPQRNQLLAKIHIGKKALGLDDDTYRTLLERVTGKISSKDLSIKELEAVMAEMKRLGFTPKKKDIGRKPRVAAGRKALLSKVEAILADHKLPWSYAESMATRMFQRKKVEWLTTDQLHKLLQALIIYQTRRQS